VTAAPTAANPPGDPPAPSAASAPPTGQPAAGEACPLCGAPLDSRQDWCLNCGAAARTRLAATPGWKGPVAAIAVVAALALGVLAAALVKLAGDSGTGTAARTTTVTTGPAAAAPTTTTAAPTSSLPSTPATTAGTPAPGASTPTVTAQPKNAGGIAAPSKAPTVTAKKGGALGKLLGGLTPSQRRKAEKLLPKRKAGGGP